MIPKKTPVSEAKLLSMAALLSDYDLFRINTSEGKEFYASRIGLYLDQFLMFERQFAKPICVTEYITDIHAVNREFFVCNGETITYVITALHKKPQEIAPHTPRSYDDLTDLMNPDYFGSRLNTYIPELDTLLLPVDPYLLGELTLEETLKIERLINVNLGGLARPMQMCRTICFQIPLHDPMHKIYVGIFDLEHSVSITSDLLYSIRMDGLISDSFHAKSTALLAYAQKVERESNYNRLQIST